MKKYECFCCGKEISKDEIGYHDMDGVFCKDCYNGGDVVPALKMRIEELEGQLAYECECNKELVDTQNENERLKTLLYNALVWIDEDNGNFWDDDIDKHEWFEKAIGITRAEMEQIDFEI